MPFEHHSDRLAREVNQEKKGEGDEHYLHIIELLQKPHGGLASSSNRLDAKTTGMAHGNSLALRAQTRMVIDETVEPRTGWSLSDLQELMNLVK